MLRKKHFSLSRETAPCTHYTVSQSAGVSSLTAPRATILRVLSGKGRCCSAFASSHGARIQTSRSSSVENDRHGLFMIGLTTAFGDVVRTKD
jgi:hypothetical protein